MKKKKWSKLFKANFLLTIKIQKLKEKKSKEVVVVAMVEAIVEALEKVEDKHNRIVMIKNASRKEEEIVF